MSRLIIVYACASRLIKEFKVGGPLEVKKWVFINMLGTSGRGPRRVSLRGIEAPGWLDGGGDRFSLELKDRQGLMPLEELVTNRSKVLF